jgi:hypothetical protein
LFADEVAAQSAACIVTVLKLFGHSDFWGFSIYLTGSNSRIKGTIEPTVSAAFFLISNERLL